VDAAAAAAAALPALRAAAAAPALFTPAEPLPLPQLPPPLPLAAGGGVPIARLLAQQFVAQLTKSLVCGAVPTSAELAVVHALSGLSRSASQPQLASLASQQQAQALRAPMRRRASASLSSARGRRTAMEA
jgi:hypothetical protein